ncbi:CalY family protein [Aeromicrobium wangtongii]|uniref:CalY family protein n=1 Tax=Aeromicrobium wangtongii TaxID=2969247 RepID=UPI0020181801|nr:CalY family protein [Aeromicrobium wangtongii]MCL3817555.1 CalY family protein [Aeromicrobium wangtongii]
MKIAKLLLPLGTLVAAGAIAVGSGATFTSSSSNTINAVTAGTLSQSNTKDGKAIFKLDNAKPGDTVTGSLTITNTGSLPAKFSLTETASSNTAFGDLLTLNISDKSGTTVFDGTFGALKDDQKNQLGVFQPGASETYVFTAALSEAAGNTLQGATASADFTWDSVQQDGETIDTDAKVTPAN